MGLSLSHDDLAVENYEKSDIECHTELNFGNRLIIDDNFPNSLVSKTEHEIIRLFGFPYSMTYNQDNFWGHSYEEDQFLCNIKSYTFKKRLQWFKDKQTIVIYIKDNTAQKVFIY